MNTKAKCAIAFGSGVALTGGVCFIYNKKVFSKVIEQAVEQVLSEEGRKTVMDAVNEVEQETGEEVMESFKDEKAPIPIVDIPDNKDISINESIRLAASNGYNKSASPKIIENKNMPEGDKISIIDADSFGEDESYDQMFLTSYTDGIIADDYGEIVADVEKSVGKDPLDQLENMDVDIVFVKNDTEKCYYQICRDDRRYMDLDLEEPSDDECDV